MTIRSKVFGGETTPRKKAKEEIWHALKLLAENYEGDDDMTEKQKNKVQEQIGILSGLIGAKYLKEFKEGSDESQLQGTE